MASSAPAAPPTFVVGDEDLHVSKVTFWTRLRRHKLAVAGMVVARQRPSTANGVVFMLLEDEYAQVNLIVPPVVYERFRAVVRSEPLLLARGRYEHLDRNRNVLVRELVSLGPLARRLTDGADVHGSLPGAHHFGHR